MTIQLRTAPPLCPIEVGHTWIADQDPFGETAKFQARNSRFLQRQAAITVPLPGEEASDYAARTTSALDALNWKEGHIFSIFIDGMNEAAMLRVWDDWQNSSGRIRNEFFKGTRFMGADRSAAGLSARCLKAGIPNTLKVNIGVKTSWTVMDVVVYAIAIRDALQNAHVTQPPMNYDRKMLPGRSVFSAIARRFS